ncbi:MAG: hypothetical protein F6K42_08430, partial [Leptolyngbya sp. SIO1D8]|nr:hypothetical protein [Leptolyngbya sp. SIO1D8]
VKSLLPLVFDAAQGVDRTYNKAVALSALAFHNSALWAEAFKATRDIQDVYDRVLAFESLASEMPELWRKILEAVQEIQGAIYQVYRLEDLSPKMPELWPITLDAIHRLWFEGSQALYLYKLADKMPESEIPKAIEIAKSIQNKPERILALSAFLKTDPNIFSDIDDPFNPILFQNDEEHYFALILGGCALQSPDRWPEVIDKIQNIQSEEQKSLAIERIASKVPETLISMLLEICLSLEVDFYRANALWDLLPYMNKFTLNYDRWCEVLSTLSCLRREMFLKRMPLLIKTILNLGSEEALVETAHAIQEVGQQWS